MGCVTGMGKYRLILMTKTFSSCIEQLLKIMNMRATMQLQVDDAARTGITPHKLGCIQLLRETIEETEDDVSFDLRHQAAIVRELAEQRRLDHAFKRVLSFYVMHRSLQLTGYTIEEYLIIRLIDVMRDIKMHSFKLEPFFAALRG